MFVVNNYFELLSKKLQNKSTISLLYRFYFIGVYV